MPPTLTTADFADARRRISSRLSVTPVHSSTQLGRRIGARLSFKCENFQKTGSFKPRGALNKLLQLATSDGRGVVTVSAGNHAQALAWAGSVTGIPSTVVMTATANPAKVAASRQYGAEVVLHGTPAEAFDRAHELERERNLVFVHPFDDEQIIAGAGSVGAELLEQVPDATVIVVPIGGGGLIAGIAATVKEARPGARVIGVEPEGAAAMRRSVEAGRAVRLDRVATIADGLAPPMAGEITFEYVRRYVDDVVLVNDDEIKDAMAALISRAKLVVEPSGAAATAALFSGRIPLTDRDHVVSIVSGGNVALEKLGELVAGQKQ